jgi:hypothetical protein
MPPGGGPRRAKSLRWSALAITSRAVFFGLPAAMKRARLCDEHRLAPQAAEHAPRAADLECYAPL